MENKEFENQPSNKNEYADISHISGVKELKEKLSCLYNTPDDDRLDKILKNIAAFQKKLLDTYGLDYCEKYALFHTLMGSSTTSLPEKIDTQGNDSIEKFIDGQVSEEKVLSIQDRIEKLYKEHPEERTKIMDDVALFTQKLRHEILNKTERRKDPDEKSLLAGSTEKSKDFYEYALYHLLEREKPDKPWSEFPPDKIDFPGNPIEKFIEELEEKYK